MTSASLEAKIIEDDMSHPWVRPLGGDCFGDPLGMKINESAEDTVVLLSLSSFIRFRMSNQLRIFDISLDGFSADCL